MRALVWCGSCGSRFLHRQSDRRSYIKQPDGSVKLCPTGRVQRAYTCQVGRYKSRKRGDKVCSISQPTFGADRLENMVWSGVRRLLEHPETVQEMIEARKAEFDLNGTNSELDVRNRRLDKLEEERQKILTAFQKGYMPEPELDIKMRGIRERGEMYESQLEALRHELANYDRYMETLDSFSASSEDIRNTLDLLTLEERNKMMKALVERVDILSGERINVHTILDVEVLNSDLMAHRL